MKNFDTVSWVENSLQIVAQTKLPVEFNYLKINDFDVACDAIKRLEVRGAPAIGIAGAFTLYLGTRDFNGDLVGFKKHFLQVAKVLGETRPTAVNLFWAIERIGKIVENFSGEIEQLKKIILGEAQKILQEDKEICRNIGKNGQVLLKNGMTVLTHCNAGGLATADYGTALGVIFSAIENGKKISVFADETRPLLQGSRLTAWELTQRKIDTTLICDGMAAFCMAQGKIDAVIVGADRIASNGDTANKIGTYSLAVNCQKHKIPFYVAAPLSTFDFSIKNGKQIPIEERDKNEIILISDKQIAPKEVNIYNPAFDVTPNDLISAIITERQVFYNPFNDLSNFILGEKK
ncbi:S-methyl-5-thioribose-1-phosphate isomerase [bacterium]|nr:S-methyl-5-thioribose-1-phosphate isomerase [bacterium]